MFKSLIFCEDSQHVKRALSTFSRGMANYDLLALTPEAAWECQLRGMSYVKIEDFYNEADLSSHAEEVFKQTTRWINWVDEFIQRNIPVFAQSGFLPASASFGLLYHNFFCAFFESAYVLTRFLEHVKPKEICYWPWERVEPPWHLWFKNPVYSTLLPVLAPRYGVSLKEMNAGHTKNEDRSSCLHQYGHEHQCLFERYLCYLIEKVSWISKAKGVLSRSYIVREISLLRSVGLRTYVYSMTKQLIPSKHVLIAGRGYDLDPLIVALRERGVRVTWLREVSLLHDNTAGFAKYRVARANLQKAVGRLWPTIVERNEFWEPLNKWGAGRNDRAESILSFWWHRLIPKLWQAHETAFKVLLRHRYQAVVAFESGVTLCGSILQAALARSIPRLIYQHGSTARINSTVWYSYLSNSERFLVYGRGTARHLQRNWPPCKNARAEVLPVGSARLDALRVRMNFHRVEALRAKLDGKDHRPVVLYVPTPMGLWGKALGDGTGYSDIAYFELQERVIRLFAAFCNVRLLYKERPSPTVWNPIPDLIRREIPNGRVIITPPLAELVWAVDAIILDHAITGLGEALLTRKRLVIYTPNLHGYALEPREAKSLLRKRAIVAETPDEFVETVRAFLIANDFSEVNTPNNEFLQSYSTYLNDGRSAQRVVDEILGTTRLSSVREVAE